MPFLGIGKKPTPPKPFKWTIEVVTGVPTADVTLLVDDSTSAHGSGARVPLLFQDPPTHREWGADLYIYAEGYEDYHWRGILPSVSQTWKVDLTPASTLTRLRVQGRHFINDEGERVNIVGADSFQAYDRWLRNDLNPAVFEQLELKAYNLIRVFGMDHWIPVQMGRPPFKPQDFGDRYYEQLPVFCKEAAAYGLYVFFDVFADTGLIMPNLPEQQQHFTRVIEALKQAPNTLGSLGNELRQHENFVDKTKMPRPHGIAFASGSEGLDELPSPPHWDFSLFHPRRDYPSAIKDCCVADHPLYVQGHAVMLDEPDGFGSPKPNGEPRNTNLEQCALQAGASVESSMGIVFHSQNGIFAEPFNAQTEPFADAFVRVLRP